MLGTHTDCHVSYMLGFAPIVLMLVLLLVCWCYMLGFVPTESISGLTFYADSTKVLQMIL